jgi:hypothetical protein
MNEKGSGRAMEEAELLLREVRRLADILAGSLPDRISIDSLTLKSKIPFKALALRELLLHRVSSLATATVDLFEHDKVVPALVLTRAIFETVAVLFSLHRRLHLFLKDRNTSELDDFLMRCLVGSSVGSGLPPPIDISLLIDYVNDAVPEFRATYERLSEYSHPTWSGLLGSFGKIDKGEFELKLGTKSERGGSMTGISALSAALMVFHRYYNESGKLLEQINSCFDDDDS